MFKQTFQIITENDEAKKAALIIQDTGFEIKNTESSDDSEEAGYTVFTLSSEDDAMKAKEALQGKLSDKYTITNISNKVKIDDSRSEIDEMTASGDIAQVDTRLGGDPKEAKKKRKSFKEVLKR